MHVLFVGASSVVVPGGGCGFVIFYLLLLLLWMSGGCGDEYFKRAFFDGFRKFLVRLFFLSTVFFT